MTGRVKRTRTPWRLIVHRNDGVHIKTYKRLRRWFWRWGV